MKRPTRSETLFRQYCETLLYTVEKIPEAEKRTPDFRVITPHGTIITEIKEACPNDEDVRMATEMKLWGRTSWCELPGKRVRAMLNDATGQTRSSSEQQLPCAVILYDNVIVDGERPRSQNSFFTGFDIATGMYGQLETVLTFAGQTSEVIEARNQLGGNRTLRSNKDEQINAVCVLTEDAKLKTPCLWVYHNSFASFPLSRKIFCGAEDKHFKNPGDEDFFRNSWVEF
ncbi:MAG TPA: hypothetical protein VMB80_07645 [Candidatus Acidoferrum sp.]|nr:hypothetical protein [Candidatus Acidoferrum sp.]